MKPQADVVPNPGVKFPETFPNLYKIVAVNVVE